VASRIAVLTHPVALVDVIAFMPLELITGQVRLLP
jgi:hypothetical protein